MAHAGGMSHGPASMQHRAMMEKLNLTDEQTKKFEDIHYQHQKKAITMRAEIESARLDLGRLMRADEPDRRAIEAQIDKVSQARVGLEKDRVGQMLEMRALLTPEQRKTWREMHGGMGMPGGMHRGMPGMMHGPDGHGSGESMRMGEPGMDDSDDGPDDGPSGH